ncbi:pseudouridine synthase [Flavihumibacter stibioxidans]|uniref:Pseudouridine synthase n=1 Tax=Flavihumibacter stibioxidans TaxID=1834163 RepID=A0ABR7M9H6_9BACT|nr:pseudouridine synthase [Flavihumibacter stibioxidans]MBC6491685.1 pseudouridine synthase [Flavihumibacter stibioxidans]
MESNPILPHRYFVLNKPYGMVSQFVSPDNVQLLSDLEFSFPEGTHAIGRLDGDSEGLLLLTTNKKITRLLFQGEVMHNRTYLVQVREVISEATIEKMRAGLEIKGKGGGFYNTRPCQVKRVEKPADLFDPAGGYILHPSIRNSWITITLTEGKFRQVRKMCYESGHKVLRLIRISIEDLELGDLLPGQLKELSEADFFSLLKLPTEQVTG